MLSNLGTHEGDNIFMSLTKHKIRPKGILCFSGGGNSSELSLIIEAPFIDFQ
jgi:hypothetical protein